MKSKNLRQVIVGLLTSVVAIGAAQAAPFSIIVNPAYKAGLSSTVYVGLTGGHCSGFKKSDHILVTAAHCTEDGNTLDNINGHECSGDVVADDGNDHVMIRTGCIVPGVPAVMTTEMPMIGDQVYEWGNPMDMQFQLRVGRVAGLHGDGEMHCVPCISFDMNIWHGDSGAGVFDMKGRVFTLVYAYHTDDRIAPRAWRMAISQPFAFTPEQMKLK